MPDSATPFDCERCPVVVLTKASLCLMSQSHSTNSFAAGPPLLCEMALPEHMCIKNVVTTFVIRESVDAVGPPSSRPWTRPLSQSLPTCTKPWGRRRPLVRSKPSSRHRRSHRQPSRVRMTKPNHRQTWFSILTKGGSARHLLRLPRDAPSAPRLHRAMADVMQPALLLPWFLKLHWRLRSQLLNSTAPHLQLLGHLLLES